MANQASNPGQVLPERTSSTAAVLGASLAGLSERRRTGQFDGNNRQMRSLAQTGARKVEESIMQTFGGIGEKMKLAVDNVAAIVQGLQTVIVRWTEASREAQLADTAESGQFLSSQQLRLLLVPETGRTVDLAVERVA